MMSREDPFARAQRLAELANGPLEKLRKHQELLERMAGHPSPAVERLLANQERMERLLRSAQPGVDLLRRWQENDPQQFIRRELEQANSASALIRAAEAALAKPSPLEEAGRLAKQLEIATGASAAARFFEQNSLSRMAETIARQVDPFKEAIERHQLWADRLEAQMRAVTTPWVRPDIAALSIEGFAVVSRLNTVVRYKAPFDEQASEVIDDDLGDPIIIDDDAEPEARDAAHIEAGMHPGMLAFAPPAVGEILIQTGFILKAEYAPLPATTDGSDPGLLFHPGHNALMTSVEQNLRKLIAVKMSGQYGEGWVDKRIDPKLVADWKQRREEAIAKGEAPLELLQYSYLMDLKDIIIRRDHWRDVFKAVFESKEHFSVSMERLHPIRLPLSHGRPIGTGQQFHLVSEASRILGAMGIDVFKK